MLKRYSTKEIEELWSDESKYNSWLLVELFSIEAYSKINQQITEKDIKNLWKNTKINVKRIEELEQQTKHDVIAFTRQISETLGEEKKWIHFGLTSTDVVDTAQSYRLKKINEIILSDLLKLKDLLGNLAKKYKTTFQIGRTHGVHAEITTFGYKLAIWFDEMCRNIERFKKSSSQIEVAKISGAVGNYANIPLFIQEYVAEKMELGSSKISTQTLQRDRHAEYIFTLSLIGSSLDKFAIELRNLQRTEIQELEENFEKNQKGSSAMPHKKNPISSENISGLSRILRGYVVTAMENIALWHERDISHSSAERFILQDSTTTLDYMIRKFTNILNDIHVNEEKMLKNIWLTNGVIFSQRAMLKLIEKEKWSREKSYDLIQRIATKAIDENKNFKNLLLEEKIFIDEDIEEIFDLKYYLKNIDLVFKRLGLNE